MNIQELDRNYQENPLKRGNKWHSDIPSKHDLEYLYITCNMSTEEICQFLPTKLSTLERWLRNYNIKKPRNLHTQVVSRKNKEKYGVANVFQVKDIQSKIINYNIYVYQAKYIVNNKDLHTTVLCKSLTDLDEILEKTKKQFNVTDFERYEIRLEIKDNRILGLHYNCLDIY